MQTGSNLSNNRETMSKRVVVINLSTSGSRLGGAAIAAEWHSRFMADMADQQQFIELWRMWDNDQITQLEHLKVRNFATQSKLGKLHYLLPKKARSLYLSSLILKELSLIRPDVIHLQNPLPALEFERIAKQASKLGIKVVASTHGFYEVLHPNYNLAPHQKWAWEKWITKPIIRSFKYIDAFISGFPQEKLDLKSYEVADEKIHLVPNGINPFFNEKPTPLEINDVIQKFNISIANPILLFIGNHTANKGLDTVLHIASTLPYPSTVIIGGKLKSPDEADQWHRKIPIPPHIHIIFTDYLSLVEQRSLYHIANILLFPSMADTLPLTILEAMECSLPVVAYDVGGISFQLQSESGILVPVGEFEKYRTAVLNLLENPTIRHQIGSNAQKRRTHVFCWKEAAIKTIEVYNNLSK
jgi:alpha-maltose-1-phosphate synthase